MSSITDPRPASPVLQYLLRKEEAKKKKKMVAGRSQLSSFHTGDKHTMNQFSLNNCNYVECVLASRILQTHHQEYSTHVTYNNDGVSRKHALG